MSGRRIRLLLALALAAAPAFAPPRAFAQAEWTIRAGVGVSLTQGRFGDHWGTGVPVSLSMHYSMSPRLAIGAELGYQTLESSGPIVVNDSTRFDPGSELRFWRIGFGARRFLLDPTARLRPYAALGVGVYPLTIESEDSTGLYIKSYAGVGLSGGLGIDYQVGPGFGIGFEARYHNVGGSEAELGYSSTSFIELSVGFRLIPGEE
jgi:opacity protein-like surface antigen